MQKSIYYHKNRLTTGQDIQIVGIYCKNNGSTENTYWLVHLFCGQLKRPSEQIYNYITYLNDTKFTLNNNPHPQRRLLVRKEENIVAIA